MANLSGVKSGFFYFNNRPQIAKARAKQPNEKSAGLKESGGISLKRQLNFFNTEMRIYIAWCITHPSDPKKFREIRCEKCKKYKDLDFHHTKYEPKERVYLKDIRISCCKCHRNSKPAKRKRSQLKTVFQNGKRYCVVAGCKFEY